MQETIQRAGKGSRVFIRVLLCLLLLSAAPAFAHLGSPDTFVRTAVGPYTVLLAAHPPSVFPGPMELDLRISPDDHVLAGTAAIDSASPQAMRLFADGTAAVQLWTATPNAHTLHLTLSGAHGEASLAIDIPATVMPPRAPSSRHLLWLIVSVVAVLIAITAFARRHKRFALIALALAVIAAIALLRSPTPSSLTVELLPGGQLKLHLANSNDLALDHGKPMHLFLVREPQLDVLLHLHPTPSGNGTFLTQLPSIPPGTYRLFADVVHLAPGQPRSAARPETSALTVELPAQLGTAPADPDDTAAILPPANRTAATRTVNGDVATSLAELPDGYSMRLSTDATLRPLTAHRFTVTLLDPTGQPAADPALYLGMSAHAVVLRRDGAVFAHIHPGGTLPMLNTAAPMPEMPGMVMNPGESTAEIPYGFPSPGDYRLFVQMKHGAKVETAAFDLTVSE